MFSGKLTVICHGAELTHSTRTPPFKMNPFLVVNINGETRSTAIHENGDKEPDWKDEELSFMLSNAV